VFLEQFEQSLIFYFLCEQFFRAAVAGRDSKFSRRNFGGRRQAATTATATATA
jgi:hypothetical protein